MKKIGLFLVLLFLTGCVSNDARRPVEDFLETYRNHKAVITLSLEELFREEDLLTEQKEQYELVLKKQYVNLTRFEISMKFCLHYK